jgi:hypothetical protein
MRSTMLPLTAANLLATCVTNGPAPVIGERRAAYAAFQRDREACRAVAEQFFAYVDSKDGRATAEHSIRVEADTQRCMLARGWNDARYDGWAFGRSWGRP